MTTRKLSSEKLLDTCLFKNLMRRRLPHILVAFLVNFFTISVPFMLWMGDMLERLHQGIYTWERYIERSADNVRDTLTINLVFMFILGIYFGIITLGYMMKRRSAHFYHALPQSRETLYVTSVVSALTCVGIGGLATVVIALGQIAAFSLFTPEVLGVFFILLFKNIIYFLVSYAITVFAGSFSGNGLVQALMTLVILFYPIATYAGVVLTRMLNADYFWEDYYFTEEIMQWLSPVFYAGWTYWGEIRILPTIFAALVIAALLLGGLAIYKKRAIENSERPIVFGKLGTVLKFMFMFTITMFAGLFFEAIGYSFFHMVFGYICGAVLSFMLFNTILAKTPKAMFKGMKGLAIFAVAFSLFLTVVCFDIFNVDDYVPAADNLSYAEIKVSNAEYDDTRFDDPEMLAALSTLLTNQRDGNKAGTIVPLSRGDAGFIINTVMYTKLGVPFARQYSISKYTEGAEEFLTLYANDARMQEKYTELTDVLDRLVMGNYDVELRVNNNYNEESKYDFERFYRLYKEEYGVANYERLSKPVVATVEINNIQNAKDHYYSLYDFGEIDYPWTEMPVYADMTKTIEYLDIEDREIKVVYLDNYGEEYEVELTTAALYDTRELMRSGGAKFDYYSNYYVADITAFPCIELTKEQGRTLGDMLIDYERHTSFSRIFTAIDKSCVIRLIYGEPSEILKDAEAAEVVYVDEYGIKYATTEASRVYDEYTFVFPKGQVPDEVKALLN